MRRLKPVIWAKGTFLTPQHLQAQDRFLEDTLQFRLDSLNFRPWGFDRLQVDHEALAGGHFAIAQARGIFPDGLPFDIPISDTPPPPRALTFDSDEKATVVYLAIPPYVERGLNVAQAGRTADVRYASEVLTLRDENTGLAEKPIQVARKNLRLLVESETREETPSLRVARVERTSAGLLQLDPSFIPPLLSVDASERLVGILRRLVEILVAKSGTLAGVRRQKNQNLADFSSSDIANFWLLYCVNSHLPLLRHVLESRRGHPEALYSLMTSLAGALTTFSAEIQPRDLPLYDHDDLTHSFAELDQKLRTLLETVVPSNFVSLPLKLVQSSIYATAIDEEKYLANTRLYLAVKSSVPEAELISRAPQLIKICSATHIEHLIRQALPGVTMLHEARPPNAIPVQLDYQYFSLSQAGAAWQSITRARNFAAYVPAEFPNPQLELIILMPQAG